MTTRTAGWRRRWSIVAVGTLAACAPVGKAEPEAVPSPVGTWDVAGLVSGDGDPAPPPDGADARVTFSEEATPTGSRILAGSGGCNTFTTSYDAGRTGSLYVTGSTAMTRMACLEPVMTFEAALVSALEQAERYSIEDGRMTIFTEGGSIVLTHRRDEG